MSKGTVLWWGRSDVNYSRNSIIRQHFIHLGWEIVDFFPYFSFFANLEASLTKFRTIDLVWVPCFRQRDLASAARWSKSHHIPLIFDPLISAYDKQVYERCKFKPESAQAEKLLQWEADLFQQVDIMIADTPAHAEYFSTQFKISINKINVIYVGADETLFFPKVLSAANNERKQMLDVLFYGSFIPLQGPDIIIKAAAHYQNNNVRWTLLGDGPLRKECQNLVSRLHARNVHFEEWLEYQELPKRIQTADIILGVFGDTPKARRVIPNKVFQSMAVGKPIITQRSLAYPRSVQRCEGFSWVNAGNPYEVAEAVTSLEGNIDKLQILGKHSFQAYKDNFSDIILSKQLTKVLGQLSLPSSG